MAKKVAVCLSGCGFLDGAEIHESVLTLLALDQAGVQAICCAPNIPQVTVTDHVTKKAAAGEKRNVLTESARIARCNIKDIATVKAAEIDALIFPGGLGAAKNLCDFADRGPECSVNPAVEKLAVDCMAAGKPIGAICIAPAMLARIVGKKGVSAKITIGNDSGTAAAINKMGAQHCDCPVTGFILDEQHKIVTTPAYMLGKGPADVFEGIRKLVDAVLKMA